MNDAASIARLFVALPVPRPIGQLLSSLQPPPGNGVRSIPIDDLHVTLHFIGSAEVEQAKMVLGNIVAQSFVVRLERFGEFSLSGGRKVLWVGVAAVKDLIDLHASVATVLAAIGFNAERRPYRPHITLARLAPACDRAIARRFRAQTLPVEPIEFSCSRFALYASETKADGAIYRLLQCFSLTGASAG